MFALSRRICLEYVPKGVGPFTAREQLTREIDRYQHGSHDATVRTQLLSCQNGKVSAPAQAIGNNCFNAWLIEERARHGFSNREGSPLTEKMYVHEKKRKDYVLPRQGRFLVDLHVLNCYELNPNR
jgi:hypothetical protein